MKKTINGKLYDTGKAKNAGRWSNGFSGGDHMETTLYRKRTGEYFLLKQTGEKGDSFGFHADIIPMSLFDAKRWAMEHLDTEEYEAEFGIADENEVVPMTVNIPKWVHKVIKNNATVHSTSMGSEVTRIVSDYNRFALDRFLGAIDIDTDWRVMKGNEYLFSNTVTGNERQIAAHGLHVEKVRVVDGRLEINVF